MLGRLPDLSGLTNWAHSLDTGMSLQSAAAGFVNSPEFQAVYGALDSAGFVNLLYHNVLGRPADPGGLANWVGQPNSGTSRSQVVLGFSESNEHIANTAPHVDYGIWLAG